MPTFKTTVTQANDMNATGIAVPPDVVEKLAAGKRPKVRVTLIEKAVQMVLEKKK